MSDPLLKVRGLKIGATVYPPDAKPHKIKIVHASISSCKRAKCLA